MKYPKQQFELLVDGLKVIVPLYKLTKEVCQQRFMLHDLHFRTFVNYSWGLENPNVNRDENGNRILPLTDFELYPNGCLDNQIETAMKAALKIVFNS